MSPPRITTHRKRIPWSWAFLICLPWIGTGFFNQVSGDAMTFTMRKFLEDPVIITGISSVNTLFNFVVGVFACYFSDRIWTRIGRRKPFLVTAFIAGGTLLLFVPLVGNLFLLVALILIYQFFVDLGSPWEPLYNEVVPPKQRGRAGIFRMILVYAGGMFFATVLVGQFDVQYELNLPFGRLTGEHVLYWAVALLTIGTGCFLSLFVKETPAPVLPGEEAPEYRPTRLPGIEMVGSGLSPWEGLKQFFRDMFGSRQAWGVYVLYAAPVIAGAATNNPSRTLYMIDQLGVSKPELAKLSLFSMPILMFIFTPLAGYLADRWNRIWMLRIGIAVPALIQLGFVYYLRFIHGFTFDFGLFLGVGLVNAFFNAWLVGVWGPVIFDYIPSRRMGTFAAGFTFVGSIIQFGLMNLSGFWVKGWSKLFGVPGQGEYDYSSIFALDVIFSIFSIGGTIWFARAVKKGLIRAEGIIEIEQADEKNGADPARG
jgi:MFS family permease